MTPAIASPGFLEKVQEVSLEGRRLIQSFEGCRLAAYQDQAGVWTIGYGTTRYPDGRRVQPGETCTPEDADRFFAHDLRRFEVAVDALTTDALTQRQFDGLVSCCYNIGEGGYRGSTLRKRVNANPGDPLIRGAFMLWHSAGGKPNKGLWRRRHKEADWYFGVQTTIPPFPG